MSLLSADEIARNLRAMGVPEDRIARQLGRVSEKSPAISDSPAEPVHLTIPWSALVSDNAKYAPASRKGKPVIVLTEPYRTAKAAVQARARDAMQGRPPLSVPLAIHARVYVPNGQRRDAVNFSKCAHDALSGIVYADDTLLHDVRWTRAGVDVDAPRAEVTVRPLTQSAA